jgi:predicted metal-binding membrane protein
VYAVYRPHGALPAGVVVVAAGVYELTPPKRACRRRCGQGAGSGFVFGLHCLGSSAGLMATLAALGIMSLVWMSVTTVLVCAQKLLPAKAAIDVPLAVALVATAVPGITPPM